MVDKNTDTDIEKTVSGGPGGEDVSLSGPDLSQCTLFYLLTKHIAEGGCSYLEQPVVIILILELIYFSQKVSCSKVSESLLSP